MYLPSLWWWIHCSFAPSDFSDCLYDSCIMSLWGLRRGDGSFEFELFDALLIFQKFILNEVFNDMICFILPKNN